jgi:hypothetical protein
VARAAFDAGAGLADPEFRRMQGTVPADLQRTVSKWS